MGQNRPFRRFGADAAWRQRPGKRGSGSASIPAAPSPISFRSIPPPAPSRVTKVASTPANPGDRRWCAASRAILRPGRRHAGDVAGLAHGTTVATNALLQGQINSLGLIVTEGFRHILEIARQSVPEGYGNSYFWVKPERIVPLRFVREVGGRLNFSGEELRPLDEASVRAAAQFFREHEHPRGRRLPDPLLRQCRARAPGRRDRRRGISGLRAVAVLRRAAGISRIRARGDHAGRRVRQAAHGALSARACTTSSGDLKDKPFLVMQSSGGVASAAEVVRKPITTALSGPAAGALGSAVIAEMAGFPEHRDARCRRHLDRPLPDRRRQAARHQRRRGRLVPGAHPDDRHRDHRHRRRLDRLDHPRRPSQGRPEERRRRARADVLSRTAATSRPSPTPIWCSAAFRRR